MGKIKFFVNKGEGVGGVGGGGGGGKAMHVLMYMNQVCVDGRCNH